PAPPVIDLEVTKTAGVPQVQTDQEASFTLAVSNRGDGATGVVVADTLPAGLEFVSATPEVSSRQGNTLTWNLGSLGRGQGRSITLRVRALRIGNWTNTVVVRGAEREDNTANNRAQAALRVVAPPPPPQADLGVIKSAGVPQVETGRNAVFTLTVGNTGPDAATGVTLTDTLPAGLEFVSASPAATRSGNTLTWNLGNLAKDERRTLTLEVRGQTPGRQLNTASVRGNERDPNPNNNRDQATLEVVAPPPPPPPPAPPAPIIDLAVSKSVTPGRVELGQEASFTLTVSNSGDNATGVVLTDTLPAGLEFVSASPPVTRREGDVLTWNLGSLATGVSRRLTVQVRGRIAGTATNTAVVRGNEKEDKTQDNTARAALEVVAPPPPPPPPAPEPRADLGLTKTVSPAEVRVGDAVRYTLTVVNNGPDAADEVVLRDTLPQGLDEVIAEGAEREGETLVWNLGSLASGERVSLTVRAIASVAGTLTNTATLSAETPDPSAANNRAQATLSVLRPAAVEPTPQPQPRPQPVQPRDAVRERESEVTLAARLASAPASGVVVVSDRLPNGARYVLGSSRLLRTGPQTDLEQSVITNPTRENSDPIADPVISGDRLFWVLPAPLRPGYVVGYRLSHPGALEFPDNRLGVILQTPQTRPAGTPSDARSSGAPHVLIGEASLLKALETARPLGVAQTDTGLVRLGGSPATLLIYPSRPLTTDRADQPELMVVVRDAQGNPSSVPYVTLSVQPEPAIADAKPTVAGYQVRVVNGEGRLPLSNLGTRLQGGSPDFVSIEAQAGDLRVQERFAIEAAQPRPLIVAGAFSLQAAINSSGFGLESTLRGFGRGSLGDTLLTGALNTGADFGIGRSFLFRDVNLLPPANPYERFPLLGDGSDLGTDTNSSDSVFLRLEQGLNYLQYGQLNTGFEGLLTGYNAGFNGLKGVVRGGGFGLNAFAAVVPDANRLEVIPGDGTTFYRLGLPVGERPVVSGSETVTRVVRDRSNPNLVLSRTLLLRGADYEADYGAGVLRLRAPLQAFDLNGHPQSLEVAYAVSTPGGPQRELRGGVQASLGSDAFGIRATLLSLDSAQSGLLGLGVRAVGTDAQFEAEATTPLNRIGLTAGAARLAVNLENFSLEARYQDVPPGFQDPRGSPNAARDIGLGTTLRLGGFSLNARYSLNQNYTAGTTTQQASAEARLGSESLALLAGAGAGFGLTPQSINNNLSSTLFASVGVEGKAGSLGFAIRQLIGLGNTPSATDLSLDLGLTPNFGIRAQSRLTYASNGTRLTGALGVRGSFAHRDILQTLLGNSSEAADPNAHSLGSTNLSATYEMGNLDGDAGRTRLGLDTTIPLGSELQLGLSGNVVVAPAGQGGASGGIALRYTGEGLQASTSLELSAQALTPGTKSVFGLGLVWRASSDLIVSPQGTYVREANGTEGTRLGLAAAYRADRFNLLTQNVLKNGFYRDADGVVAEGEIRTGYQADERFFLRLGAAYRFADGGIFTGQVGGGFTFFLTDVLGLGLNGSYLFQPATSSSQLSFGLEASLRVADGLTFSAGTNLLGTSTSLVGFQSQTGFYLRLDWLFDERFFGVR
ncbi:MAG: DUF11 domain-containing protein, partial [Meiothermus sp.]|nr:DUF11 domain-containing protein [Meiothermus sp.]